LSYSEITAVEGIKLPLPEWRNVVRSSAVDSVTGLINGFFGWFGSLGIFA